MRCLLAALIMVAGVAILCSTGCSKSSGQAPAAKQTQLLPSSYLKYAVDFNGDGTRDLIRDTADALASTANFLQSIGWKRGEGFQEGDANFAVLLEWNKARVYAKTIARLAQALSGETE
jgi:membrane-bound lytic murein transglycosylase B